MVATGVIIILVAVLYVLFWIAVSASIVYLIILIVRHSRNMSTPRTYERKRKLLPNPWAKH